MRPDLRPLAPHDAAAVQEFVRRLSPRSRRERTSARGEIGIVVADAWQGRGLGRELMQRLTAYAPLHGVVHKGNRAMLRLADRLGHRASACACVI